MGNKSAYHYSNVSLIPKKGILKSRSKADTSIKLGDRTFMLPVMPSNMKCTIDPALAHQLAYEGYFYIMHRFDSSVSFIREAINKQHFISISIGVKTEDRMLIQHLMHNRDIGVEYITLDIAHGHSEQALDMIKFVKDSIPNIFLIAGNIATAEAAWDLRMAGADAVKVGIGQGNACTTKDKTGFTVPMFTCVQEVATAKIGAPIIADGGIKCNGDIAKALVAGADMVMCGSLFAECSDSPSDIFQDDSGQIYKMYFGSASEHNKTEKVHIEGTLRRIPQNTMTYIERLEEIRQDLSSAISYSGGTTLKDLKSVNYYVS